MGARAMSDTKDGVTPAEIEAMLRDALAARAATVSALTGGTQHEPPRERSRQAWVVPLLAAASVIVLLGAIFVGSELIGGRHSQRPEPAHPLPSVVITAPATFLGIRNGDLQAYDVTTGQVVRTLYRSNAAGGASSAAIAPDGTVYFTTVSYNDPTSGVLWQIAAASGEPTKLLDPTDFAPRSVVLHDGMLAIGAGSRQSVTSSNSIVLARTDGTIVRRIAATSISGTTLGDLDYLGDGRLAVESVAGQQHTTYVIDPGTATSTTDGPVIPVDPGWQVSAVTSGADGVLVAFWSGTKVELDIVNPTTFVSTATLYASSNGEVIDRLAGVGESVLGSRNPRLAGRSVDASSTPFVLRNNAITAVPGLEPPATPPIDVVRILGWITA
jgi:hypothetical protein